ncbi:amidohydrolase family protein [Neobacillus sp. SAB-20_R2A]|uniref:amidohydrolase family protein n=1 Tax=Neobacillus sp. SAB-20_R2A TaxID=3120519 RepID=UPI003C6E8F46
MIIDALCGHIPSRESIENEIRTLGKLHGYIDMFGHGAIPGITEDEFNILKEKHSYDQFVEELAVRAGDSAPSEVDFIKNLDDSNVKNAVMFNEDYETTLGVSPFPNDALAEFVHKYPNRFLGLGGVDPWKGEAAGKEVERCVRELGLHGVLISPFKSKLYANDSKYYPIYKKCEENGVPIYVHFGINWWYSATMDYGRPIHLDKVACEFPNLKIVGIHGGWPWVNEAVMLAWRHPNFYIDISTQRPKFFTQAGSGWEMLLYFGARTIQNKILFGSASSLLGVGINDLVEEVRNLPLKETIKEKWLYQNSLNLFKEFLS